MLEDFFKSNLPEGKSFRLGVQERILG